LDLAFYPLPFVGRIKVGVAPIRKIRGGGRCPGSRIETFQRVAAHSGSALGLRKKVGESGRTGYAVCHPIRAHRLPKNHLPWRNRLPQTVLCESLRLRKIKRGADGAGLGFGSGNEAFQELAGRFGSARAVMAIEFARDPDDAVHRQKVLSRHRADTDDERFVESVCRVGDGVGHARASIR
jgi:hypothetical protein